MEYNVYYEDEIIQCLDTIEMNNIVNRYCRNIRRDGRVPAIEIISDEFECSRRVYIKE